MPKRWQKLSCLSFEQLEERWLLAADFTFGILPDTQYYAESYPEIFNSQTQWIADNVQSANIAFVSHVGDVVDNPGTVLEWERADAAMDILDGDLAANPDGLVPYSLAPGNHDYDNVNDHSSANQFANYFGESRYAGRSWYGGSSPDELNHYQVFSAGEYQFLNISLEWEPRDSAIAWAQGVLDAHAELPTIITTHAFLHPSGDHFVGATTSDGNDGQQLFQKLIAPNSQIFLTLSGHYSSERHETTINDAGLEVFEILANYQKRENGGNGWMQLLNFRPDLNRIDVTTYSPWLDQFETDANSQFSLNIDFNQRFTIDAPPTVQLSTPLDSGADDLDSANGAVKVNTVQPVIELQLSDIIPGIDDATVTADTVSLRKNGSLLVESVDYTFSYDSTADRITLTPNGGPFGDGDYELNVSADTAKIADLNGNQMEVATLTVLIDTSIPNPPVDSLYFSLRSPGTLSGGLSFESEDIVFFDGTDFSLLMDGSDVGLSNFTINGLAIVSESTILLSFTSSGSVPGIASKVDDSDIVKFTATQLGDTTSGTFELYFDGSDVGLSGSSEDVDALTLLPNGNLLISTSGSYTVEGVSGGDEDLLEFTPNSLGETTGGTWSLYFDGSDVGLGGEDVNAVNVFANGNIYLSNSTSFSLPNLSGKDEDVFVLTPSLLGTETAGSYLAPLFFDGSGYGLSTNDIYAIHVPTAGPVNAAPVAEDDAVSVDEDASVVVDVLADNGSGPDGDADGTLVPSSTTVVNGPANGTLVNNGDGTFLYTPVANFFGSDSFTYTVRDNGGAVSNVASVFITVNDVNDAPLAKDDWVATNEAVPIAIDVLADNGNGSDSDVDGTLVASTVTVNVGPTNGTLQNNGDGTFLYTPTAGFIGSDSFTYTFDDDDGTASNVATVTITVAETNDAPLAVNDTVTTSEDTSVAIDVLADNGNGPDSDPDGTLVPSSIAVVSGPANGSLVNNVDGTFLYTPDANFFGSDGFTYTIQDNDGATSNTASVAITVSDVNDAPLARNDAVSATKDTSITIDVLADNGNGADTDVDGLLAPSTTTVVSGPTSGALQNNGDATFLYTPDGGFIGTDSFTYTVADDDNTTSNVATVSIAVVDASSATLYFSLSSTATIDGVLTVANEDIVAFDGTDFSLLFDGSDVGISGESLNAFAVIGNNELLLSFRSTATLPGIALAVTENDIVKFTAVQFGDATIGQYELYFDGSDVGLSGSVGKIDAIDLLDDGRLLISTTGSISVPGADVRDEDLLAFTPTSLGADTAGSWKLYFDGSQVGFGGEDIDAVAVSADGTIYLSAQTEFVLAAVSGDDEDVFVFTPTSLGDVTSGSFDSTLYFDGSQFGLTALDVRGIDIVTAGAALRATSTFAATSTTAGQSVDTLTQSQAEAMLAEAIELWRWAMPDISIPTLTVTVADLPGDWLGMTQGASTTFDVDAGGGAWFVDASPQIHEEFTIIVGPGIFAASDDSRAEGRYDLLTVAAHEVGHAIGLHHSDRDDLMAPQLPLGTRRLPISLDSQRGLTDKDYRLANEFRGFVFDNNESLTRPQAGSNNESAATQRLAGMPDFTHGIALLPASAVDQIMSSYRQRPHWLSRQDMVPTDENMDHFEAVFADGALLDELLH